MPYLNPDSSYQRYVYGIFCKVHIGDELIIEKMLKKNDVKYDIFLPITKAVPEEKYNWILTGSPLIH